MTGGKESWLRMTEIPAAMRCTATADAISLVPRITASGVDGSAVAERKLVLIVGPCRMQGVFSTSHAKLLAEKIRNEFNVLGLAERAPPVIVGFVILYCQGYNNALACV
jgi:hypothetical protein